MVKNNVVKFAVLVMTLVACESKVEEDKHTGTAVVECPAGTGGSGGGDTSTTSTRPPGSCLVSEDCGVPANCVTCPGSDVCQPVTATCLEGMCQLSQPSCPGSSGGGGQGGSSTGGAGTGGVGGMTAGGGASTGGASQGGSGSGGVPTGGSGGSGGSP